MLLLWTQTGIYTFSLDLGLPRWLSSKEYTCQCRRLKRGVFYLWLGKIPWSKKWKHDQYSCLENSMDRGAWRAIVHGVTKSQTWLSGWACTHTHTHTSPGSWTFGLQLRLTSMAPPVPRPLDLDWNYTTGSPCRQQIMGCLSLYNHVSSCLKINLFILSIYSLSFHKKGNTKECSREVKWCESCSVVSDSLRPHGLYSPWNSPGQNIGVGCLSLL